MTGEPLRSSGRKAGYGGGCTRQNGRGNRLTGNSAAESGCAAGTPGKSGWSGGRKREKRYETSGK